MPASAALSTALTGIPLEVAATDVLEPEVSIGTEFGCSGAWAEVPAAMLLPSCAGAVAVELPDGQMVSTTPLRPPRVSRSPERPTAHTCEVPGAFATSNMALSCVPLPEIALGKAVQLDPSQSCVEATLWSSAARYSRPTAHALVGEEASIPIRMSVPSAPLALGTWLHVVPL